MAHNSKEHINDILTICRGLPVATSEVETIKGVGPSISRQLANYGYKNVLDVFEQFLLLKRDEDAFRKWVNTSIHSTATKANIDSMFIWLQELWQKCYDSLESGNS